MVRQREGRADRRPKLNDLRPVNYGNQSLGRRTVRKVVGEPFRLARRYRITATTANTRITDTAGISKIHTGLPLVKTVIGPSSCWLISQSKQPHFDARANRIFGHFGNHHQRGRIDKKTRIFLRRITSHYREDVRSRGLEPPWIAPLVPEASVAVLSRFL